MFLQNKHLQSVQIVFPHIGLNCHLVLSRKNKIKLYVYQMNYYMHSYHWMNSVRARWPTVACAGTHCEADDKPAGDLVGTLEGTDVPRERDHVTPEATLREELRRLRLLVATLAESSEPALHARPSARSRPLRAQRSHLRAPYGWTQRSHRVR